MNEKMFIAFADEMTKIAARWVQKAKEEGQIREGTLSAKLGIPEGKNIPASKLAIKPGDSPKTKKQKTLAKTFKKMSKK